MFQIHPLRGAAIDRRGVEEAGIGFMAVIARSVEQVVTHETVVEAPAFHGRKFTHGLLRDTFRSIGEAAKRDCQQAQIAAGKLAAPHALTITIGAKNDA